MISEATRDTKDETMARLRATMARLNMNQSQMARYLGVPQGTICNWLSDTRAPSLVVARLLDVLGTLEAIAPQIHAGFMPGKSPKK